MLRRQKFPLNDMSFLAGNGEMATSIRKYDWSGHPFGRPETWPQSLRSALGICLNSSFPTAIYWGPELRLLYNDAWAPIPGPRHPDALGSPAAEVWSDIWHVIEPQFVRLIETGEGVFVEDQMLPMHRFGLPEETYWSYSFTPIRGEDGAIAGVFNSGLETTRNVLSQRQMLFLLELGEVFRSQTSFEAARRVAVERLGQYLGALHLELSEISPQSGELEITERWANAEAKNPCDEDSLSGSIVLPWKEKGKRIASLSLRSGRPYPLDDFDITAAEKVLERIMISAERMRVAERETLMVREINHRARNSLAVVQSVVRQTSANDLSSFRKKIEERIAALARSHDLLSDQDWRPVELRALLSQELSLYLDQRAASITLEGPSVRLAPPQAQLLGLMVHELKTNAAKYGSLSTPDGGLEVNWSTKNGNLRMAWNERSTTAPDEPGPDGFGSTLLKRVIQNHFGGTFSRRFDPTGLQCEIELALEPIDISRRIEA